MLATRPLANDMHISFYLRTMPGESREGSFSCRAWSKRRLVTVRFRSKKMSTFVANAIGEQPAHHYMMAMSNGYKIYIMDSQHRISLAFEFSGPNDESAVQVAREHAEQNGVEVWKGSCLVAQIAQRAS
jgi:hypothetical protein